MKQLLRTWLLLCATALLGQSTIPNGTILPLELTSSLNSGKSSAGKVISARVMQDVPLTTGEKIRAGSKVMGRVIEVNRADNNQTQLALRFDTVIVSKQRISVVTNLRALASPMAVWDAQVPKTGPDHGTPENAWTTVQIGNDEVVYRGGGPVANGLQVVGEPTARGVLVRAASKPGSKCRGTTSDASPQALWVFSSDACGLYSLPDLRLVHAGRTSPVGQVILASVNGNVRVKAGSGMLLRVTSGSNEH